MDPAATLMYILAYIATDQFDEARELLKQYEEWRAKGGHHPPLGKTINFRF